MQEAVELTSLSHSVLVLNKKRSARHEKYVPQPAVDANFVTDPINFKTGS